MKWKSYILVGASCLSVLLILVGASYYFPMMESLKNIYIGSSKFYEWIVNVLLTIWRASLACGLLANIATSRMWVSLWGRCIALRLWVTLRCWITLIRLWVALIWLGGKRVACISGIVSRLGLEPWKGEKKKLKYLSMSYCCHIIIIIIIIWLMFPILKFCIKIKCMYHMIWH